MRTWPSKVFLGLLLLLLILDFCCASPISSDLLSYPDDDASDLSHYLYKRRLGVRLPNILRLSDHQMDKRRLGVRLPNILFQRDGTIIAKKADDNF